MFEGVPNYPTASRHWEVVDKHRVSLYYTAPTAIRALMREGEEGTILYFVDSGTAEVQIKGSTVAQVQAGDVVGEIAVLASKLRTATVIGEKLPSPNAAVSASRACRDATRGGKMLPCMAGCIIKCSILFNNERGEVL